MDFDAVISRFAIAAQAYCSWLESAHGSPVAERSAALCLLAELYSAAHSLPDSEPGENDAPSLTPEQCEVICMRLRAFPFQNYWEVFDPLETPPEHAVCGDVTDDLSDIYTDVKEGLLMYPQDEKGAVWHWRESFANHWGRHATSALRALHAFDPEAAPGA